MRFHLATALMLCSIVLTSALEVDSPHISSIRISKQPIVLDDFYFIPNGEVASVPTLPPADKLAPTAYPKIMRDDAVNCVVSDWSVWSDCNQPCGLGNMSSSRTIQTVGNRYGASCPALVRHRECKLKECPVDCKVSAFSAWSTCSLRCGGGLQSRSRNVTLPAAHGGLACPDVQETRACNEGSCCDHPTWEFPGSRNVCQKFTKYVADYRPQFEDMSHPRAVEVAAYTNFQKCPTLACSSRKHRVYDPKVVAYSGSFCIGPYSFQEMAVKHRTFDYFDRITEYEMEMHLRAARKDPHSHINFDRLKYNHWQRPDSDGINLKGQDAERWYREQVYLAAHGNVRAQAILEGTYVVPEVPDN